MTEKVNSAVLVALAALLGACAAPSPSGDDARTATIQRTANGVAHVVAPDAQTLALRHGLRPMPRTTSA